MWGEQEKEQNCRKVQKWDKKIKVNDKTKSEGKESNGEKRSKMAKKKANRSDNVKI